jgi:hypothetical protein
VMVVRILERQSVHHSSTKNGLRSRTLTETEHAGLSLRLEGCAVCKTTDDRAKLAHVILRPSPVGIACNP